MAVPGAWLILRRELRGALHRARLVVTASLWVLAAAFATYADWPEAGIQSAAALASYVAQQSQELFILQFLILMAGVLLTVPAIAAMSFSQERSLGILDQLRLTPIRESRIVIGKLGAVMTVALLFMLSVLPVFAVTQFLLGLDNGQVARAFVYMIALVTLVASIGVACATIFRRATSGAAAAYAIVVVVLFGPVAVAWLLAFADATYAGRSIYTSFFEMMMTVPTSLASSGMPVVWENLLLGAFWAAYLTGPAQVMFRLIAGAMGDFEFAFVVGIPLALAALALFVAARRLGRDAPPVPTGQGQTIDDPILLATRRKRFPYYLIDPLRRNPCIADSQNPVFVHAFRYGLFRRTTHMVRASLAAFTVFAVLFALASLQQRPDAIFQLILLQAFLVVLLVPALSANSLADESDPGNFDMIRMTLIPARTLILGRFMGESAALSPFLLAAGVAQLPALTARTDCYFPILAGYATILNCAFMGAALGVVSGAIFLRIQAATVFAVLASFAVSFGSLAALMLGSFVEPRLWERYTVSHMTVPPLLPLVSPVWSYVRYVCSPTVLLRDLNDYGVPQYAHWWLADQLLFAGIASILMFIAIIYFHRYRMRDP